MNAKVNHSENGDLQNVLKKALAKSKGYLLDKQGGAYSEKELLIELEDLFQSKKYCDFFWRNVYEKNKSIDSLLMEFTSIFIKLKEIDTDLTNLEKNIFCSVNTNDIPALGLDKETETDPRLALDRCETSFRKFESFASYELLAKLEKINQLKKPAAASVKAIGMKEPVAIKKISTLINESIKFIIEIDNKLGRREPYKCKSRDKNRKEAYDKIIKTLSAIPASSPLYEVLSTYSFRAFALMKDLKCLSDVVGRKTEEMSSKSPVVCKKPEEIEASPQSPDTFESNSFTDLNRNSFASNSICSSNAKTEKICYSDSPCKNEDKKCNKVFVHGGAFFLEYDDEDQESAGARKHFSFRDQTLNSIQSHSLLEKSSSLI